VVLLTPPSFLVLPAFTFVALMSLLALPLVTLGVLETLPLVALGPFFLSFCHPTSPISLRTIGH